ncbi:restriction endonuclease subunit S [Salegentibacter agarivorans]|jgi:type I restriction enzyme S subunit|uniref:Restriction endonuclease subunit S n=1 Tax=Christiangramia sediminicola TaxID=3073267 RepID=A0ABU1EL16_9FLAO|nr:restriction endonuclease subunit S [Christiangramia sp. SM2212]MDR5589019.1 restriction endonuclease subunit S [Christiangramia sp. SM2212]
MSINFPNKPDNWKVSEFRRIAELRHGYQFRNYDFTSEGIKIFKITQIKGNATVDISSCSYIDPDRLKKFEGFRINKGDILMALTGATIGKIARYTENETILQNYRVGNFFPLDEDVFSKDYLYHFLRSKNFYNQILAGQTQSAQQNIGKEDINKMSILVPPIKEQKSIASILSALDDKIELNLQMNKTLEEMAMAIYKHWFVDFGPFQDGEFVDSELGEIPKGWEVKNIKEIAEVNSKSISKNSKIDIIEYIDIASVGEGLVENIQPILLSEAPSRARRIISDGDIVWSTVRPNRKSRFLALGFNNRTIVSTGFAVTSPKTVPYSFLYPFTCTENFVDYLVSRATGSSYPAVTGKIFEEAKLVVPTQNILEKYNEIAEPLYLQFSKNNMENQTLTQLRDTLLPKLISGEVRVKDAEKTLSEVL